MQAEVVKRAKSQPAEIISKQVYKSHAEDAVIQEIASKQLQAEQNRHQAEIVILKAQPEASEKTIVDARPEPVAKVESVPKSQPVIKLAKEKSQSLPIVELVQPDMLTAEQFIAEQGPTVLHIEQPEPPAESIFTFESNELPIFQMPIELPLIGSVEGQAGEPMLMPPTIEGPIDIAFSPLDMMTLPEEHVAQESITSNIIETFSALEPAEQQEVAVLMDEVMQAIKVVTELRTGGEDIEAARTAEEELQILVLGMLTKLDIDPTEENTWKFISMLVAEVNSEHEQAEWVDEGTHEQKFGLGYLLKQLMQLAKQSRLPHLRLGRLVCKQLTPLVA